MGKKDQKKEPAKEEAPAVEKKAEKPADEAKADAPEDTPIVKELKELDDKYLSLEREYEKELAKLQKEYTEKQKPFLDQRKQVLTAGNDDSTGTPACKGFWLQALKNHPAFEDHIEEWDEPVLEYLQDVTVTTLDDDLKEGPFKLEFVFCENPFFTNTTLWKEYHFEEESPYTGDLTMKHIDACEIDWKPGKDVTVEKVAKKVKGGGAKKAKQKKEKAEPRDSVFRNFFRSMKKGDPLPDDVSPEMFGMDDEEDMDDDEGMVEMLMDNDYEMGSAVRDNIIPFAVRWYTGEAAPRDDDDDEDEEEEDGDDDDEEDEDSEEEEPKPRAKGKAKGPKKSPESKPAADPKAEECKQQ